MGGGGGDTDATWEEGSECVRRGSWKRGGGAGEQPIVVSAPSPRDGGRGDAGCHGGQTRRPPVGGGRGALSTASLTRPRRSRGLPVGDLLGRRRGRQQLSVAWVDMPALSWPWPSTPCRVHTPVRGRCGAVRARAAAATSWAGLCRLPWLRALDDAPPWGAQRSVTLAGTDAAAAAATATPRPQQRSSDHAWRGLWGVTVVQGTSSDSCPTTARLLGRVYLVFKQPVVWDGVGAQKTSVPLCVKARGCVDVGAVKLLTP